MNMSVSILGTRGYPSYYGGFETLVRVLAPYLADQGWDVKVYGRANAVKLDDPTVDRRIAQVSTRGLETKSASTLTYGMTSVASAARNKPDVALIMNVANGFWLPMLRARDIPSVVNVDGIEWERAKWGGLAKRVFKTGARLTASHATELVCDSVEIRRRWELEFGRTGHFIPYGGAGTGTNRLPEGLKEGKYILAVARFVPENTMYEFIEAARLLAVDHDVVIVGSSGYGGPIEDTVRDLARSSRRVSWLGHIDDDVTLHSLWKNAGAYFHGHSVGGTNPALVQAMAEGAPIVARDTVYNREVLGQSGTFVAPNVEAIRHGLDQMVRDSEAQLQARRNATARSAECYTWEAVCSQYHEVLKETAFKAGRMGSAKRAMSRVSGTKS